MSNQIRRGDIWWMDWSPGRGSEQIGRRPSLVVQTDVANVNANYRNTVVVAISTSGRALPIHIRIEPGPGNGLNKVSYVKCEQMVTVSKERLERHLGHLNDSDMQRVDAALRRVLDL